MTNRGAPLRSSFAKENQTTNMLDDFDNEMDLDDDGDTPTFEDDLDDEDFDDEDDY